MCVFVYVKLQVVQCEMGDLTVSSSPSKEKPTVLLTGFGPFRNHLRNSSWLTVQELLKLNIKDFKMVAKEIPVEYETVSKLVPALWEEYKPMLAVHCGMSENAKCLTLERNATNKYYISYDVQGKLPCGNVCCDQGPDVLCTNLNLAKVREEVSNTCLPVGVDVSEDAGKYLCEFIYYTSLKISKNTAFVHVPPVDKPYTARQLAESLAAIIQSMLKQCEKE